MTEKSKAAKTVLLFFVAAFSFFVVMCSLNNEKEYSPEEYRQALGSIYKEYDGDIDSLDRNNEFALRRLIVSDYDGNNYGADAVAVDSRHSFAVLQYDTEKEARVAFEKISADGHIVDADTVATLESADKGEMHSVASETLGTTQFISKFNMQSDEVITAVIDTGVMYDHEAIEDRFYSRGYDFSADECEDAYYDTSKEGAYFGHATFVCGIIADNTMDNVKILPYKAVQFGASAASASAVISAINDAVDRGASVINVSLSNSGSGNAYKKAVANAVENGVCLCTSAGNDASEIDNIYPAFAPGAITVSALEEDMVTPASFTNFGDTVDFCAPGRRIISTYPYDSSSDSMYRSNSGTSFSSPYLAAVCANIKSIDNTMSKDDVYSVICDFAVDLGDGGYDVYCGNGLPDLSAMTYTDGENYSFSIPEGTLYIYKSADYTKSTQPWRVFAKKLVSATVDKSIDRIGDYTFYNMENAVLDIADTYDGIGDFAFYGCKYLKEFTFTVDVNEVGNEAFGGIDDFVINGFLNTPAETYALREGVRFNALGCRHNYIAELVDPTETQEGYTIYTCIIDGDTYTGPYVEPTILDSGECGEGLSYTFDDMGRLSLFGNGSMYDYMQNSAPWSEYTSDINTLDIKSGVQSISPFAFFGCTNLAKIRVSEGSNFYTAIDDALYSKDEKTLVLLSNNRGRVYAMPDTVENFDASALLCSANTEISFNDNFTVLSDIVFDGDGNIVCALPSYKENQLNITDNITVNKFAFILTKYPDTVLADAKNIAFCEYSLGWYYNGEMEKGDVLFKTYDSGTGYSYASHNRFRIEAYNKGKCGENVYWLYDIKSQTLTLSGSGDMYCYSSAEEIPWSAYMSSINTVLIGDEITSLSDFAFYDASALNRLTLPLSLEAPENNTVWYNCSKIKTLSLTLGSGYMDDYSEGSTLYYKYTPWYISTKSITSFSLDENAIYIGDSAFRGCTALKSVTLNECSHIGTDAFLSCSKLNSFTNYSKNTEIADYSIFSSKLGSYSIYSSAVMYAFDDSTSKDYCEKFGANFVSLGCGHSRDVELIGDEIYPCCTDNVKYYHCYDCESDFEEITRNSVYGHCLTGELNTLKGREISDAEVYLDGELSAVTNSSGEFIIDSVLCGEHTLEFEKHNISVGTVSLTVDKNDVSEKAIITYGDLNLDGYVNGRDVVYAKIYGFDDYRDFDYGKIRG